MTRIQLSTNISAKTKWQADQLRQRFAYSLRDVVTIAIDQLYHQMKKENPMTRFLTDSEINAFPGDSSVNVAIQSTDGEWYYGDGNPTEADPSGFEEAGFVVDDDGYYIPVSHR